MMIRLVPCFLMALIFGGEVLAELSFTKEGEQLRVKHGESELFAYQFRPMENPVGGENFAGSNFIHPLRTPAGFAVTALQPADHPHHFGLWWPWKKIKVDGRKIITWELQQGEGLIQAREAIPTATGFFAKSDYIDRTAPDGPMVVLKEAVTVDVADFQIGSAKGYFLDIEITHRCASGHPVEVVKYRYSGFTFRATLEWTHENSAILTSAGKGREEANFSRAAWLRVEGAAGEGESAGVLMMGHPANHSHPEWLRTWDQQHDGAVFVNFNPVQEESWNFARDQNYVRRYRVFVYDGTLTVGQAERLWAEHRDEK